MLGIFRPKPILSQADMDFQLATFTWLLKHFGGKYFYEETKLVLPSREFFPAKVDSETEAAIATFHAVKKYAGMENWPCRLEAQEQDIEAIVAPALVLENVPGEGVQYSVSAWSQIDMSV